MPRKKLEWKRNPFSKYINEMNFEFRLKINGELVDLSSDKNLHI